MANTDFLTGANACSRGRQSEVTMQRLEASWHWPGFARARWNVIPTQSIPSGQE